MDFGISVLLGLGAAYLGEKASASAKEIGKAAEEVVAQCDAYRNKAPDFINARRHILDNKLSMIGELNRKIKENEFLDFIDILNEKFTNLDVAKKITIPGIRKHFAYDEKTVKKDILRLRMMDDPEVKKTKFAKCTAYAALGAFGASAFASALGIESTLPAFAGSTVLGIFPFAIGIAYSASGFLERSKALKNLDKAKAYLEDTKAYSEYIVNQCKAYDEIISFMSSAYNKLSEMASNFSFAYYDLKDMVERLHDGKHPIDISKLDDHDLDFLSKIIFLSHVLYATFNIPLLNIQGFVDSETKEEINTKYLEAKKLI